MDIFKDIDLNKKHLGFGEFIRIQNNLQILTTGRNDWYKTINRFQVTVAILDEISELSSCFPWKWWKKGEYDEWNSKIETIDIMHFWLVRYMLDNPDMSFDEMDSVSLNIERDDVIKYYDKEEFNHTEFWIKMNGLLSTSEPYNLEEVLLSVNLTTEELSGIYVAKATLNAIRANGGYADGSYIKNIGGVEDNYHLQAIVGVFNNHSKYTLQNISETVCKRLCNVKKG